MNTIEDMIKLLIRKKIPDGIIKLKDLTGKKNHYLIEIISEIFRNKSIIHQHQIVYNALKEKLGKEIHAINLKTSVPTS